MGWVKLFLLLLYVIFYSLDLREKKHTQKNPMEQRVRD